jgi:hypothetical protein
MENRRKHRRYLMFDMLPVALANRGGCIGCLMDLTPAGMMIRSHCSLKPGGRYGVRVDLREPIGGETRLEVVGDCQWCRQAPSGGFNAGLSLIEPTPRALTIIEALSHPRVPAAD